MHCHTALNYHGQREGIKGSLLEVQILMNDTTREDRDIKVLRC